MVNYFKDFLINILFTFCPLFFYPYLLKIKHKKLLYGTLLYILFSIALFFTMSFPVTINSLVFDFRIIPLTIGSLYGGPIVSLLLYINLIISRWLTGIPNQFDYILSILPTFFFVSFFFIRKFSSLTLFKKMATAMAFCIFVRLYSLISYLSLTHAINTLFAKSTIVTLLIIICQSLICALFVYFLEYFRRNLHIQQEIIKSEKIKIVSDIAASVAHEIRNPLTSVRGFIQLLGNEDLKKETRLFYQKISLEELDRAQQIISDYLTLAKPEPENIEIINITNEITYTSNILLSYANYQNVVINLNLLDEQLYMTGDKYKFRQALINIGKNAIEAMPNGGNLKLDAKKINQSAVLTISDSGIGMTAEQINRLGTPYYSTKEKGTGLGTMVSFSIIKKMHGIIDIQSEIGKGTIITISFPLKETISEG